MTKYEFVLKNLPKLIGGMAVTFFKQSFDNQGVTDKSLLLWDKRKRNPKKRDESRAILVKSARLKRSIRIVQEGKDFVTIGSDVPYAQAHNEGFIGSVSQSVKPFTRKGKPVKGFNRTINQKIPKRQFMGFSHKLESDIERVITDRVEKAIRTT